MKRLRSGREICTALEREGFDYADILDAMDEVEAAAETADGFLYDAAGIVAIREGLRAATP